MAQKSCKPASGKTNVIFGDAKVNYMSVQTEAMNACVGVGRVPSAVPKKRLMELKQTPVSFTFLFAEHFLKLGS